MFKPIFTLTTLAIAMSAAAPAVAGSTQDDVQTCRAAMTDAGMLDMNQTRLRFKHVRGNHHGRTLTLQAINVKGKGTVMVKCHLGSKQITTVERVNKNVKLAKK